ncbi:MAG: DUF3626 domain-containing protein, partial [Nocardioides sp.]
MSSAALTPAPRVAIQFQPDWPYGDRLVIESIARDGRYRSQFETRISNGGVTAHPGGARWEWEHRLFNGRYDAAPPEERPVYGAHYDGVAAHGPAPRFGSAYLVLREEAAARATYCFPDSFFNPDLYGGPEILGKALTAKLAASRVALSDPLDDYVEAQVHGELVVQRDVEAVWLDPSHRGGRVERAAEQLGCAVRWHPGFRARTDSLDPDYRGVEHVDRARSLGTVLTPAALGEVAQSGV